MLKEQLDRIMRPKSIAVVGASTKEHTKPHKSKFILLESNSFALRI